MSWKSCGISVEQWVRTLKLDFDFVLVNNRHYRSGQMFET